MSRCIDETCEVLDNNAILDISPYSNEDPLIYFKVELTFDFFLLTFEFFFYFLQVWALTSDIYFTHLRECWYSWLPINIGYSAPTNVSIIRNGCSINPKSRVARIKPFLKINVPEDPVLRQMI